MGFWDSIKNGVSSLSGSVQGQDPGSGFQLINPNGPRPVTVTSGLDPWSQDFVNRSVESQLQQIQAGKDANARPKDSTDPTFTGQQGGNPYGVVRQPWVFATFDDIINQNDIATQLRNNNGLPPNTILWYANPKSVDWTISQRGSEAKTKAGTVLHIWRDRLRQTDYDDPKITITFQSGSIHPQYPNSTDQNALVGKPSPEVPAGLDNFYHFLQLVDTSKIKRGHANLVHILYRSRIFPSMVISGFFDPNSVVRFTDSADNPYQVNSWSSTFTIYRTVPAYNDWSKLAAMFREEFKNDSLNHAIQQTSVSKAVPTPVVPYDRPGKIDAGGGTPGSGFDPSRTA